MSRKVKEIVIIAVLWIVFISFGTSIVLSSNLANVLLSKLIGSYMIDFVMAMLISFIPLGVIIMIAVMMKDEPDSITKTDGLTDKLNKILPTDEDVKSSSEISETIDDSTVSEENGEDNGEAKV